MFWAVQAPAAEPLRAYLSAPARIAADSSARIDALVVNPGGEAVTFTYEAKLTALEAAPETLKREVWLGAKARLPISWQVKPAKAVEASFALFIDGKKSGERTLRITAARKPPLAAKAAVLSEKPLVLYQPADGAGYEVELEVTTGPQGELAATLHGLAEADGLDTDAIVARALVAPALAAAASAAQPAQDLDLLLALQDESGGWGATPLAAPDVTATSWALFWLGHAAKAGGKIDAKAVDRGIDWLRKRMPAAEPELRARVLPALAANGKASDEDRAAVSEAQAAKLTPMGRLLAAYAGANLALPPKESWDELNAKETAVLALCLAERKMNADAAALLPRLAILRGAEPKFRDHEAPLYALALKKLSELAPNPPPATVTVLLDGATSQEIKLGADSPLVRRTFTVAAPGAEKKKNVLSVSAAAKVPVFCRVLIRPPAD